MVEIEIDADPISTAIVITIGEERDAPAVASDGECAGLNALADAEALELGVPLDLEHVESSHRLNGDGRRRCAERPPADSVLEGI